MPTTADVTAGYFFDGDAGAGDPGQVGPYSAREFAEYVRYGHNYDAEDADRGVLRGILAEFGVEAIALAQQIRVLPGAGLVQGRLGFSDANIDLDVPDNLLGAPRLDRLVLRRNESAAANVITLEVLTGTTLAYPALTQDPAPGGIWEIPLWRWQTPFPFTDLTGILWDEDNDERRYANDANGAYALLTNASGADVGVGTVAHRSAAADRAFTTSNIAGLSTVIGVTAEYIAAGAVGKVLLRGVGKVRVSAAVALMDPLGQSAVLGEAQAGPVLPASAFAIALEASGGADLIDALVIGATPAVRHLVYTAGAAIYQNNTVNWQDVDAANITVTIPVYTGRALVMCSFMGGADNTANSHALFDIRDTVSGSRAGDATYGLAGLAQNSQRPLTLVGIFNGLSRANHTFRLQFRNLTAGAAAEVYRYWATTGATARFPIVLDAVEI